MDFFTKRLALVIGAVGIFLLGGLTIGVVMAAIPDQNGIINACYKSNGGDLRVSDSGSCNVNETPINWSQSNEPRAYGFVHTNGELNTAVSKNISSITPAVDEVGLCIDIPFAPKNVFTSGVQTIVRNITLDSSELDEPVGPNGEPRCQATDDIFTTSGSEFFISIY